MKNKKFRETSMKNNDKRKKAFITKIVLLTIGGIITLLGFIFYNKIYDAFDGWFAVQPESTPLETFIYPLIPNIIGTIQVLIITVLVLYLARLIISKIFKDAPRRLTIGKLIKSAINAAIWVACIIAILKVWGVKGLSLVAGTSVVTLVIGLGMQSLIADVIAGVFLVCDGTLQVGDIVTIDGWRGTVQEIGIRNTKLINYSGDIRVANNSTIKIFVNQSRENSYPIVLIGVPYDENLQHVKEVFETNKDKIMAMCPSLLTDIDFNGVEGLSDSSVNLHFGAKCSEENFFAAQREMRGAIKTVFEENGIKVPFPQLDVHNK